MNFSVHLPQPLLVNLDTFAKARNISRSSIVREAVEAYLAQKTKSEWSPDMLAWMQEALQPGFTPCANDSPDDSPDFDAIRREANAGWAESTARHLKDLEA